MISNGWTCSECGRFFSRQGQGQNPRKFAELRPMQRWVAVSFSLRREARHPTIIRKVIEYGNRYWHTANVATPADLDEGLRALLTEAFDDPSR